MEFYLETTSVKATLQNCKNKRITYGIFLIPNKSIIDENTTINTFFFKKKKFFYKKTRLKNPKTYRKCYENLQPQMPELKFLKTLIFPRAL